MTIGSLTYAENVRVVSMVSNHFLYIFTILYYLKVSVMLKSHIASYKILTSKKSMKYLSLALHLELSNLHNT